MCNILYTYITYIYILYTVMPSTYYNINPPEKVSLLDKVDPPKYSRKQKKGIHEIWNGIHKIVMYTN